MALAGIAAFYRIPLDTNRLQRDLALGAHPAKTEDLIRAANVTGLRARKVDRLTLRRLARMPLPAIVQLPSKAFMILAARNDSGIYRIIDPVTRIARELPGEALCEEIEPFIVLVARRLGGTGIDPRSFGMRWFIPTIWRYRKPLAHVLISSLFVQLFALVTPLFFQVVVDKVLTHKVYSTLYVLVAGLTIIGVFDVLLQYLRTYALSHSTNRIDVELGRRLFHHLLRLPLAYFETRAAGQTVARVRELENIRSFLTGQALFSVIDLIFTSVFIAVLFAYSTKLTFIVLATLPIYVLIGALVRPFLRDKIKKKFDRGAISQQFLVETIVGMPTVKSAAVEPLMQVQWEERLAQYVRTSFEATLLSAGGQNAFQYVNKLTTAFILLFGAQAVIDGQLTVGALIAFNMIATQAVQPILRLSQLWQDFQQVHVSVERLGDILNFPAEPTATAVFSRSRPRGAIEFKHVTFRYRPGNPEVLKDVSFSVRPGEVIGIIGPSGSGKSTLAKLIQRLYQPESGAVLLDGNDLANVDASWLRANIGIVLQENILFNRSVHENIAFAVPAMPRPQVIEIARLAGADEFISRLPNGYDTIVEERGANISGGQRQRIAIARALAPNPPILIFDEATSALDYESERAIQNNMAQIVGNRTVIIIAHRLAAVRSCNRIIGIEDGRIVEIGKPDELRGRKDGLYARLWEIQSEGACQ